MLLRGDELICHLLRKTGAAFAACIIEKVLGRNPGSKLHGFSMTSEWLKSVLYKLPSLPLESVRNNVLLTQNPGNLVCTTVMEEEGVNFH